MNWFKLDQIGPRQFKFYAKYSKTEVLIRAKNNRQQKFWLLWQWMYGVQYSHYLENQNEKRKWLGGNLGIKIDWLP